VDIFFSTLRPGTGSAREQADRGIAHLLLGRKGCPDHRVVDPTEFRNELSDSPAVRLEEPRLGLEYLLISSLLFK
jgi:hypothetical protein